MKILREEKDKILNYVEDLFKSLFEEFTVEEYLNQYFPFVNDLNQSFLKIKSQHDYYEDTIIKIDKFLFETKESYT